MKHLVSGPIFMHVSFKDYLLAIHFIETFVINEKRLFLLFCTARDQSCHAVQVVYTFKDQLFYFLVFNPLTHGWFYRLIPILALVSNNSLPINLFKNHFSLWVLGLKRASKFDLFQNLKTQNLNFLMFSKNVFRYEVVLNATQKLFTCVFCCRKNNNIGFNVSTVELIFLTVWPLPW